MRGQLDSNPAVRSIDHPSSDGDALRVRSHPGVNILVAMCNLGLPMNWPSPTFVPMQIRDDGEAVIN
jgi:hypothetical protein